MYKNLAARKQVVNAEVRWFRLVGADAHIGPPAPGPGQSADRKLSSTP